MVLGNNTTKKPLYTVKIETKPSAIQGSGNTPAQPVTTQQVNQPKPVVKISVENMTLDQLLSSYKKQDDDEEPMLPGFNYLKKMKNTLKAERVKSVLRR
jgi:hypothetical protein